MNSSLINQGNWGMCHTVTLFIDIVRIQVEVLWDNYTLLEELLQVLNINDRRLWCNLQPKPSISCYREQLKNRNLQKYHCKM